MPDGGKHRAQRGGPPRAIAAVVIAAALVLGVVAVYWATRDHGSNAAATTSSPPTTTGPPPTQSGSTLPEGRTFVWVKSAGVTAGAVTLRVDPARFYTGDAAVAQAKAHGNPPPENGYYIVNDETTQLTVRVSPDAAVTYVPQDDCCEPKPTSLLTFLAALEGRPHAGWPSMDVTPWFVVVTDGKIVALDEQYLPS